MNTATQAHEQLVELALNNAGFQTKVKHAGIIAWQDGRVVTTPQIRNVLKELVNSGLVTVAWYSQTECPIVKIAA